MGKGRIVTDHGQGRYTIELIEDRLRAASSRASAVARIDAIDARLVALEEDLVAAQQIVDQAAVEQDAAIDQYQADLAEEGESEVDLATFAAALLEAAGKRDAIRSQISQLKVERLALRSRIDRVDALPALRQVEAWCADLTEDLAGDVGTAEVPGEAQQVLVHPGHEGAAAYDQSRDGALQPALSGTPAGVFYNLAMLPGWQKWRPTYRIATIATLSAGADTCDIDIAPATSSQQGLNVNAEPSYAGVPIQYMTCNAAAFAVGDRVLVRFDRQDQSPTVVGFESNPRACGIDTVVAVPVVVHFNDAQAFLIGSPCACGFTLTGAGPYTQYSVVDYAWNAIFDNMLVWESGKLATALSAADASAFPPEDAVATSSVERNSPHFKPTLYEYEFPISDNGVCTTQTDHWSHVAVTRGTTITGASDTFFGGEIEVDPQYHQSITLDGDPFQVSYTPAIIRRQWESLERGVFTTSDDGTNCTAAYLLSKEADPQGVTESAFTIFFNNMPAIVTSDGKARTAKGMFHVVLDNPTFSSDGKNVAFSDGTSRIFSNRLANYGYLLVGYGR